MNTRKYLEISSSHRNRNLYPNIAEFDVLLGVPKQNPIDSLDPVLSGVSYMTWSGNTASFGYTGISSGTLSATNGQLFLTQTQANPLNILPYGNDINNANTILNPNQNYYNGYRLTFNNTSNIISQCSYNPLNDSITSPFPNGTGAYIISDPSSSSLQQIHIPYYDAFGNVNLNYIQAYNGYYIIDETLSANNTIVSSQITGYDTKTNMAILKNNFGQNWLPTDIYTLHKDLPVAKYLATGISSNSITLPSYLTYGTGYFNNQYIYDIGIMGTGASSTGINFQMINGTGTAHNSFFLITDYSGSPANIATISNNSKYNNTLPNLNNYGVTGLNDIIYISPFLYDNYSPLNYNGSIISQSEDVSYEVSLINLCLPNVILKTGSYIENYSYIYVQLIPISSSSFLSNNINYSNNPNSGEALFICPIDDINNCSNSAFVKIRSDQIQTIKMKPNSNFHIKIFLPDGTLFSPYTPDYFNPFPTNNLLQIEALFSFKRL